MPIIAPIKDAQKPYDYEALLKWYNENVAGGGPSTDEDLLALAKLLLPRTPGESAAAGAMIPSYLVSANVMPGTDALHIGLFESENKMDLAKFVKEVVANAGKYGYNRVNAMTMPFNSQGGRSMASLFKGVSGKTDTVPITALKELIENKEARKRLFESMKGVRKGIPRRDTRGFDFEHVSYPHSLAKQLEEQAKWGAPSQAEYVSRELEGTGQQRATHRQSTQDMITQLQQAERGPQFSRDTLGLMNAIDDLSRASPRGSLTTFSIRAHVRSILDSEPHFTHMNRTDALNDLIDRVSRESAEEIRRAFAEIGLNLRRQE